MTEIDELARRMFVAEAEHYSPLPGAVQEAWDADPEVRDFWLERAQRFQQDYLDLFGQTVNVLAEVQQERAAQDEKWGEQNHPDGTGAINLPGAVAWRESSRSRCDSWHRLGKGTWEHILTEEYAEALAESDLVKLRTELIQVAAVAVGWVEAIDRREVQA